MGEPTLQFFDHLATHGKNLLPAKYEGTIRFDLTNHQRTEHWLLTIHRGDVGVSRAINQADCVMHASNELFDQLASGEESWLPLLVRGAFVVEGDLRLLTVLRKLLPGPPGAHHPREVARTRRKSS